MSYVRRWTREVTQKLTHSATMQTKLPGYRVNVVLKLDILFMTGESSNIFRGPLLIIRQIFIFFWWSKQWSKLQKLKDNKKENTYDLICLLVSLIENRRFVLCTGLPSLPIATILGFKTLMLSSVIKTMNLKIFK